MQVGSVILVEEDPLCNYAFHLLRYFLAEGVAVEHAVLAIGSDGQPQELMEKLPRNLTFEYQDQKEKEKQEELQKQQMKEQIKKEGTKMTIAWQYEKYLDNTQEGKGVTVHKSGGLRICIDFDFELN